VKLWYTLTIALLHFQKERYEQSYYHVCAMSGIRLPCQLVFS
jgi:hypothetical protein